MKRIALLLLLAIPMMLNAAVLVDGLYYNFNSSNMTAEVSYHYDNGYKGNIVIPEKVWYNGNDYTVTTIGDMAFNYCSSLISVVIPNTVTTLGMQAFCNCSALTSIVIPNSVTGIGSKAFSSCSSLRDLTIGENVSYIGSSAFASCVSLTSIVIPNSVTDIGASAFSMCSKVTSITIGKGVINIGDYAFNTKATAAMTCDLKDVYCYAEAVPFASDKAFPMDKWTTMDVTLHAPAALLETYKTTSPWNTFNHYSALEDEITEKCATPVIIYEDGLLKFSCETEDVIYSYAMISADPSPDANKGFSLSTLKVLVVATKAGYLDSDIATKEIKVGGKYGDTNGDGVVNAADIVPIVNIIMTGE